jgi:hypothetical protein
MFGLIVTHRNKHQGMSGTWCLIEDPLLIRPSNKVTNKLHQLGEIELVLKIPEPNTRLKWK